MRVCKQIRSFAALWEKSAGVGCATEVLAISPDWGKHLHILIFQFLLAFLCFSITVLYGGFGLARTSTHAIPCQQVLCAAIESLRLWLNVQQGDSLAYGVYGVNGVRDE